MVGQHILIGEIMNNTNANTQDVKTPKAFAFNNVERSDEIDQMIIPSIAIAIESNKTRCLAALDVLATLAANGEGYSVRVLEDMSHKAVSKSTWGRVRKAGESWVVKLLKEGWKAPVLEGVEEQPDFMASLRAEIRNKLVTLGHKEWLDQVTESKPRTPDTKKDKVAPKGYNGGGDGGTKVEVASTETAKVPQFTMSTMTDTVAAFNDAIQSGKVAKNIEGLSALSEALEALTFTVTGELEELSRIAEEVQKDLQKATNS